MKDFRDLQVWRNAYRLTLDVYAASQSFPAEERFGLTSQLRRSALSIPSIIAEGCGRDSDAELSRFLRIASGSASEVECQLMLARDLKYLSQADAETLLSAVQELKRMLCGLLKKTSVR